ncbi:unnamed protein product [Didymodactylos carnosus]|uniref:C2H2-type domain-containing protein n=1 Tax=Didymodactylos carnosus TaxID=1234261 RepID=A0A814FW11_9BILA|nr:unnamed protein product [Didymodactylos carnosus]CAF3761352.1 unnamed protein product [Didymodactylos carnosus]
MDKLDQRTCSKCECYFPSKGATTAHGKIHSKKRILRPESSPKTDSDNELITSPEVSEVESETENLGTNQHDNSVEYEYVVELISNYEQ